MINIINFITNFIYYIDIIQNNNFIYIKNIKKILKNNLNFYFLFID